MSAIILPQMLTLRDTLKHQSITQVLPSGASAATHSSRALTHKGQKFGTAVYSYAYSFWKKLKRWIWMHLWKAWFEHGAFQIKVLHFFFRIGKRAAGTMPRNNLRSPRKLFHLC